MSKILDEYSYNIPKFKTGYYGINEIGGRGGKCPKNCQSCIAFGRQCKGCDILFCPDKLCKGDACDKCAYMCYRAGDRLRNDIGFLQGLSINSSETVDKKRKYPKKYIPAINKKLKCHIDYPIISIPFYAIYDFKSEKIICHDIKDYFNISKNTEIIINFYFKDDKILKLFDYLKSGYFWKLIRQFSGIKYWHTPCFSVFDISSAMDILLNFKRQFWVGDEMRDKGFDVIQEVLYTESKKKVHANIEDAFELVEKKGIKNISQCAQLDFDKDKNFLDDAKYIRQLSSDISFLYTGYGIDAMKLYNRLRPNMYFSNYVAQYKAPNKWIEYVKGVTI